MPGADAWQIGGLLATLRDRELTTVRNILSVAPTRSASPDSKWEPRSYTGHSGAMPLRRLSRRARHSVECGSLLPLLFCGAAYVTTDRFFCAVNESLAIVQPTKRWRAAALHIAKS